MTRPVYLTASGSFLPGKPIHNDMMERYLGCIAGKPSRLRKRILRANGIKARHYALDEDGCTTHLNEELAAAAVQATLADRGMSVADIDMLALGTTQGDVPVPGFASMVHGRIGGPAMEVLSAGGVCCSGMAALKAAWLAVACGGRRRALAGASEQISRILKASRFERESEATPDPSYRDFDADFLRWMLSDGAGTVMLEPAPHADRPSLRVDWVELISHAGSLPTCMYTGLRDKDAPSAGNSWLDQKSVAEADRRGMMNLRQDTALLPHIVAVGGEEYLRLVQRERFRPAAIDHVLCHYSSHYFRKQIFDWLKAADLMIPEERWFTNLYEKGNMGAASIFVMLDECLRARRFKPGEQVLLVVPESGRFAVSFAKLTCVAPEAGHAPTLRQPPPPVATEPEPRITSVNPLGDPQAAADPLVREVMLELGLVWSAFERRLRSVPLVRRVEQGRASLGDYRRLLLQLRQQVIEGARWIARAASNLSVEQAALRSRFIHHAAAEQHDYRMLEEDYVAVGGDLRDIHTAEKNIGSEALSAYMFQQASQPDPLHLLGAMFVIEGLGASKAMGWAEALAEQLDLAPEQTRFLRYHGANDDDHFAELRAALDQCLAGDHNAAASQLAKRIVKTARVTARLYALQLEEVDHA